MSGFIKTIKNLLSGILSFFIGLLGGKKSEQNKPNTPSSVEKLAEATSSSAEQLADATAKTSSGIVSSFTELVGREKSEKNKPSQASSKNRKRSGYFMELDEAEEMKSGNGNQPAKAEAKTPKPVAKAQPAKAESAQPNKADAKAQPAKEPAKEVELVQTAQGVKAEPAKKEKAAAASANGQTQTETTFAPKYLAPSVTSSNGRRRPGPSMNNFLDMARQVKTPGKA
jgi:hypothetical protein